MCKSEYTASREQHEQIQIDQSPMSLIACSLKIRIDSPTLSLFLEPISHANTRLAGPWHTLFHPFVMIARKAGSSVG